MPLHRFTLPLLAASMAVTGTAAQTGRHPGVPHPGLNVIVEFSSDADRAYRLSSDGLVEAAKQAARAEGWEIDPNSSYVVRVGIDPVTQRQEDLYAFKINVEGGAVGRGATRAGAYNITTARIVDIPLQDHSKLVSATDEMVRSVAYKLRARTQPRTHR